MEDTLINFKTAKLAKEKGFNLKVHDYFSKDKFEKEFSEKRGWNDEYWGNNWFNDWNTLGEPFKPFSKECYSQPTQSLLQKWLREKHNIYANVQPVIYTGDEVASYYQPLLTNCSVGKEKYKTYEDALEIALFEGLKLIINTM